MNTNSETKVEQEPRLVVYRASAGSGKTFTLATRFIELLIKDPKSYKEILAVTFTVKATAEMKERILSQLYGLAHALPDSQSYLLQILSDLEQDDISISEDELRQRAARALQLILHDYSNFNVETIDSFFQRILRNLARELELNANLRVELDNEEVEQMAVDRLLAELKPEDKVLSWIMSYIHQQMSDDKNWKVVDSIKNFGKKIFSHDYQENAELLAEKVNEEGFFENYQATLQQVKKDADEQMKQAGERFQKIIEDKGYTINDFCHKKSGPAGYFDMLRDGKYIPERDKKIPNSYVATALISVEGWVGKNSKDHDKLQLVEDVLLQLLIDTEAARKECVKRYKSADETLKHLNELRLLDSIERVVKDITSETNRFLLSDTQPLLDKLMEGTDTPFVLEKTGGRIRHIMIDEFQDTSTVQWNNFKKLLLECMAYPNSENLIVGDVKQSIYRWRNSDWHLLYDIAADPQLSRQVNLQTLASNFRSEGNIVRFNNEFFVLAPCEEQSIVEDNDKANLLTQIYSAQLTQQKAERQGQNGLVDIQLLSARNNNEFDPACMSLVRQHIETLIAAGANPKDIAILARNKEKLKKMANQLKKELPHITFVSDEAFMLSSSVAVNIVVNAMKALRATPDPFARAQLAIAYQINILGQDVSQLLFARDRNTNVYIDNINAYLPEEFTLQEDLLRALPLNDMAEQLTQIFRLYSLTDEAAYIFAFFDQLSIFTANNSPDLDNFANYWDETMNSRTVKGGDIQGIRLLTIHKSKGLEFDHVILPFCNWKLDMGSTLWLKPTEEPFSAMPVVPLESRNLKNTIFEEAYHEEKLQNTVDNLNLLYVAFTRAKKNLFVVGKNVAKATGLNRDYRSGLLQAILPSLASTLGATLTGNPSIPDDTIHFTYGDLYVTNTTKSASSNIFLQEKTSSLVGLSPLSHTVEFRQSNRSREFVADEDKKPKNEHFIKEGNILHNVMAHIRDIDDVDRVLENFVEEGIVNPLSDDLNHESLARMLRQRIENNHRPLVREWFASGVEVLNECTILTKDPETGQVVRQRPDRVVRQGDKVTVVDFKFAHKRDIHYQQVQGYMRLLSDMGHSDVKGYLWYVYDNEIIEVK